MARTQTPNRTKVYSPCERELRLYDEVVAEFIDISEDFEGRDSLVYKCALCGQEHTSNVYG